MMTNETTTAPTPQQVLDLPLPDNDSGATTVRGYLIALLATLWAQDEDFSGKRPFGNSGWTHTLYKPLIGAGFVRGSLDEWGYIEEIDGVAAYGLIRAAITALGEVAR